MGMIKKWLDNVKTRHIDQQRARLKQESEDIVQVREWYGVLYVAVHDVPLIAEDELKQPIVDAVRIVRATYVNHKCRKL